jgi:hypothetical protein
VVIKDDILALKKYTLKYLGIKEHVIFNLLSNEGIEITHTHTHTHTHGERDDKRNRSKLNSE